MSDNRADCEVGPGRGAGLPGGVEVEGVELSDRLLWGESSLDVERTVVLGEGHSPTGCRSLGADCCWGGKEEDGEGEEDCGEEGVESRRGHSPVLRKASAVHGFLPGLRRKKGWWLWVHWREERKVVKVSYRCVRERHLTWCLRERMNEKRK